MNCRDAQRELALLAGDDLGDSERAAEVRQHVAECSACRRKHAGVQSALAALAATGAPGTYESVHSLWPGLKRKISAGQTSSAAGWNWQTVGPAMAGLVVCTGLMISTGILLQRPVVPPPSDAPAVAPAPVEWDYHSQNERALADPQTRPAGANEFPAPRGALLRRMTLPE